MSNYKTFPGVKDGQTFEVAGIEFIKFPSVDGKTPAVARNFVKSMRYGENPNLRDSYVLPYLQREVLPGIIEAVGEENVLEFETDLITLDGLTPYGKAKSRISLPTFDFYRGNVSIFDQYPAKDWWWLATPDSAQPHYDPVWVLCVSPSGNIGCDCSNRVAGARPILIFESSIFESFEE